MMTRVSFLLAFLGLSSFPSESFAQKKYALFIGVNEYDHDKLKPLNFAVNDAVMMGELLEKHGYEVTYLTDKKGLKPTKANIEAALDNMVSKFAKGDTLIIGLAGHGLQYPGIKDCYFCPSDAKPFKDETKTMVSLGSVWSRLEKTYSGTKLVLVDACRDDGSRSATESIPLPPKGVGVLMSCSDGQFAREHESLKHGVFFHQVMEALNGAAKDSDNEVTWDRLREYVKRAVPRKLNELYGADSEVKQNPNEMGNLTEVPVLVKLSGGTTPKIEPKVTTVKPVPMDDPKIESGDPKAGEERTFEIAKGVKMKFCWIPAGEAQLGCPKEELDYFTKTVVQGLQPDFVGTLSETKRGKYKTKGFWLGKYEVTQSHWEAVVEENPSHFKGANLPVERVSWNACQDFIKKCSVRGFKVQLPHEDQWEYAYRGGKGNKQAFYWGNELNGDKANCNGTEPFLTDKKGDYKEKTMEVGSFEKVAPHPWGLCDMSGNVWEWCDNLYDNKGDQRVIRGGGWNDPAGYCTASCRLGEVPELPTGTWGFRLALVP